MDREEILKRSRQERQDEGLSAAGDKGRRIGVIAFCGVYIAAVVFSSFRGDAKSVYLASALFWAYTAAEAYPKYRFTGKSAYLVTVVAGTIAAAAFFANFVLRSFP